MILWLPLCIIIIANAVRIIRKRQRRRRQWIQRRSQEGAHHALIVARANF